MLFTVQELPEERAFVQSAIHSHSRNKQQILEHGDIALLMGTNTSIYQLAGIVSGWDVLLMGCSSNWFGRPL